MPEIFLCIASKIKESLLCVTLFDGGKIKYILDFFLLLIVTNSTVA